MASAMASSQSHLDLVQLLIVVVMTMTMLVGGGEALSLDYYAKSCPKAEAAVAAAVKQAMAKDRTVPAGLLRLHFHDCFVRGCDGSVLLDSSGNMSAEKDGPPNASLHAFYVIDNAKAAVEALCPGVVSCADILALAARDAVAMSGGPSWQVPVGRRDGRVSLASETTTALPGPTASFDQLKQAFHGRGMSTKDLVVLSGGHTLGFAHCSSLDPTSSAFDNFYYRMLLSGRGLLSSDEALLTHPKTRAQVTLYAASQPAFFRDFVDSMLRMSSLNNVAGEVRANCRRVN
ncbi:Os02g0833900 [Oryza sativa Japonica Group]|uniref:Peroxidase n=2 Tax=Oryza sativa subsp. japonica TaxID=39947 RepID=A0A0P0VRS0_ORYSJ|nr:hypothetical protein EE612_014699 [Oryza sativa]BAD28461.1 putative peroxidase [Oryza sativa Japonica Group]BAD29586.1 putative peroxidase [Oryza sativa Japonica Group]BAF10552.1 Os02g0833900 [Oryza sativa Japonica Group]BAS81790.1 Os02g0833900 [Oryza sativa Japonica Group]|eukprot:NP_001048638.1 Os02g0833900 [Oryza sativa Japonica Group]